MNHWKNLQIYTDKEISFMVTTIRILEMLLSSLFPDGIHVDGASNINRLSVLFHIIDKVTRYIANFIDGGHEDSLDDISVYSQMPKGTRQ